MQRLSKSERNAVVSALYCLHDQGGVYKVPGEVLQEERLPLEDIETLADLISWGNLYTDANDAIDDNRPTIDRAKALSFIHSIFNRGGETGNSPFYWWFMGMFDYDLWLACRDVEDSYNKHLPIESFRETQADRAKLVQFLRDIANALEPGIKHVSEED